MPYSCNTNIQFCITLLVFIPACLTCSNSCSPENETQLTPQFVSNLITVSNLFFSIIICNVNCKTN